MQDLHGLSAGIREDGGAKLGVEPVRPGAYTARIPKPVVRRLGAGVAQGTIRLFMRSAGLAAEARGVVGAEKTAGARFQGRRAAPRTRATAENAA